MCRCGIVVVLEARDLGQARFAEAAAVELAQAGVRLACERHRLVEAVEHGEQEGAVEQREVVRRLGKKPVETLQRLPGRNRTHHERELEEEEPGPLLAREPRVLECLLGSPEHARPSGPRLFAT